ncbi:hypothetical protein H7J86_17505 [Mycobacterium hackensackense]|uniref:putative alpha/beta hydrolase n=1 Tax=Mycobacterium hackensackense TaxID=228909 RepID=UPI002265B863|nr:hypothetical protein [Mycobacterium hackensackense]MCV7253958.1 hypothetical protein [Mycobacterium hackensackense]
MPLQLKHLNVGELIGAAGGDPWQLDRALDGGSPGEISELASAFYEAGVCTRETSEEFNTAKQRFESAWDRQDGGAHPINDSAEVQRATDSLHLTKEQMSRIGVELQTISAALSESQRSGKVSISNLEARLEQLDDQIDARIAVAAADGRTADWSDLKAAAIDATANSLHEMQAIHDAYGSALDKATQAMSADGYHADPTSDIDGQGEERNYGQAEAQKYGEAERAADQELVNSPGGWTPEKQAAAGRLRDYATINDPTSSVDETRYAGERLNDYETSRSTGPLPIDPVLGGDARTRAQRRLEMQQKLEQGLLGSAGMTPDQATELLDSSERQARELVITRVQEQLQQAGMSPQGAAQVATEMSHGIIPKELVEGASAAGKPISGLKEAFDRTGESLPTGSHWNESVVTYSAHDVEALKAVGSKLGVAGNLIDLGVGLYDIQHGVPVGQVAAKTGGGMAGAWALGALGAEIGAPAGPPGVFIGSVTLGTIGAIYGEDAGDQLYNWLAGK